MGVVGLVVLIAVVSFSGGSRSAVTPGTGVAGGAVGKPAAAPAKVGDTITAPNWSLRVVKVERIDGDLVWSQYGNKATAVGQWLVLTVELKNLANQNHTLNTWDFELRTAAGQTYKHSTESGTSSLAEFRKQTALGKQVPPGATITASLVFDVAKGTEGVSLVFSQAKDAPINVG